MSSSHRAYLQNAPSGPLTVQSVPTPTPSSGQALVSVLATPILSYTDSVIDGSMGFPLSHPLTPGISAIGRIISTGPDAAHLSPGQLVYCNPAIVARDNSAGGIAMLHGWFGGMTSESNQLMEKGWRNGAWAETMLAPLENILPLDETILLKEFGYSIPDLCWINSLLIPFGGWLAGGLSAGSIAIVAPATGHLGACAVTVAVAMGARFVIAVGRNEKNLKRVADMSNSSGIDRVKPIVLSGDVEADSRAIRALTPGGRGADVYLDFSPFEAGGATHPQSCVGALKFGGQAILMGGVRTDVAFNYALLMTQNLSIRGNFMYDHDAPFKFRGLIESGLLNLKGLNTHVFGFDELQESITFAKRTGGVAELTVFTPVKE